MTDQELVSRVLDARKVLSESRFEPDNKQVLRRRETGQDPVVSVEVLAYNQGGYLEQCVESIVRQRTDFPFEIIIGNDCSTDNTFEVAQIILGRPLFCDYI